MSSLVSLDDTPSLTPHPLYAHITSIPISLECTLHNTSGQVPIPDSIYGTTSIPTTLSEQIDICLSRISLCLGHLGAKISDIAVLKYFMVEAVLSVRGQRRARDGRCEGRPVAEWTSASQYVVGGERSESTRICL